MKVFGLFELFTPEALWLLLLLPAWWLWRRLRRKDAIVFSRTPVLARGPHVGGWVPRAIFTLRNLALAFLVLALSRPRSGAHTETQTSEGINIVLAIDLSSSMLALDFRPNNRIEVAKATVKQFIARRTSDRIGVVAFAGESPIFRQVSSKTAPRLETRLRRPPIAFAMRPGNRRSSSSLPTA